MRSHWRRVASAAAVLVALGLGTTAGCSTGAPAGPPPVEIGALVPVTGLGLTYYAAAFQAAARDVNAHGGIKGRPVHIDLCDDKNDPNLAQACARQMVSDGVIATAADVSQFSMVEAPILDAAGIPQVGPEALNPEDTTLPTSFPLDGGITVQIAGGIAGIRRRGLHTLYLVTQDSPPGRLLAQATGQLAAAAEVKMAGTPSYIPGAATDFGPYVQAAMQSKADVVFPALPPTLAIPFLLASRQVGARYTIMSPSGEFTPAVIALMGGSSAATENEIGFAALPPISAADRFPAINTFVADMDAELATGDLAAAADQRTGGSLAAWLSVMIIAHEAAGLDVLDASHLLQTLRTKPTIDTLGLTPPWSPSHAAGALPALPRVANLSGYLITQKNGVEVLVDPTPVNPFQPPTAPPR